MRYLLFNWDEVSDDITNPMDISDEQFEELARTTPNGHVFESSQELQDAFNLEVISTATHQLRVIDNFKPVVQKALDLMKENVIGAWESDLEETREAVITEDFKEVHDKEDLKDREDGGIIKYNGWGELLTSLIFKPN